MLLQIKDLHKKFGKLEVLKGVNISVEKGEKIVILGSSGSGKSTALRCVNLLETPTSGQILYNGEDITATIVPVVSNNVTIKNVNTIPYNPNCKALILSLTGLYSKLKSMWGIPKTFSTFNIPVKYEIIATTAIPMKIAPFTSKANRTRIIKIPKIVI